MARTTIDRLIINTPGEEPERHWRYERETRTQLKQTAVQWMTDLEAKIK